MAKATMILPNGTKVDIEGTTEEVAQLLNTIGQGGGVGAQSAATTLPSKRKKSRRTVKRDTNSTSKSRPEGASVAIAAIVNVLKSSDEAEAIEERILDKTSQVDRTLLPLYAVHEYMEEKVGLTSGDINRITTQLGIPISTANASRTLSGTASRYVMADSVRQNGVPVRYQLSRRGAQYMKGIIKGQSNEDPG